MGWSPNRKLQTLSGLENNLFHVMKVKKCPLFCSISLGPITGIGAWIQERDYGNND